VRAESLPLRRAGRDERSIAPRQDAVNVVDPRSPKAIWPHLSGIHWT
jgi:hypothetical protein